MQIKVFVYDVEAYRGSKRICLANSISTPELVFRLTVGETTMFIILFSFLKRVSGRPDV